MKKILASLLGIEEDWIESYNLRILHDLRIEDEYDYGRSYPVITGDINSPQWEVTFSKVANVKFPNGDKKERTYVNLEELFEFMYSKILKL